MTTTVAAAIARTLQQESVEWVSTFPVCRINNALGAAGIPMIMMRDDRYGGQKRVGQGGGSGSAS